MDSFTQITLGAAMGEVVLGKKIGNKAMVWGAFAGTLPDLDILLFPWLDGLQMITIHRGFSHSLIFAFIIAPILGWLLFHWYKSAQNKLEQSPPKNGLLAWFFRPVKDIETPTYRDWTLLFFLGLFTHPILDSFTIYGTQLFLPFSDYRVGFNNIFIVDPLYTVPFAISLLICSRIYRTKAIRKWVNYAGIAVSCAYICFTFFNKYKADNTFQQAFADQNLPVKRYLTAPTPLNSILWYAVAEVDNGYLLGYYSMFDKDKEISFDFIEQNGALIEPIRSSFAIDRLMWFSKGYYIIRQEEGRLLLHDVKYGRAGIGENAGFVFTFEISEEKDGAVSVEQTREIPDVNVREFASLFWQRLKGEKVF